MEEEQYSDDLDAETLAALEAEAAGGDIGGVASQAMASSGSVKKDSNFLHIQISNAEMLEKLENFYRGNTWGVDKEGNYGWVTPDNKDLITFNDFGVSTMMDVITKYIDKNTTLSYYSEDRIYEILGDLGDELVLLILANYEKMGMDTHFKKTKFRVVIVTTLHMIESAYRRALRGKTMEEVNQSRVVGQFGNVDNAHYQQKPMKYSKVQGLFNR